MVSMSDERKERNILKLILTVRFPCATLDMGHPICTPLGSAVHGIDGVISALLRFLHYPIHSHQHQIFHHNELFLLGHALILRFLFCSVLINGNGHADRMNIFRLL
jgi:hypothetical protein